MILGSVWKEFLAFVLFGPLPLPVAKVRAAIRVAMAGVAYLAET